MKCNVNINVCKGYRMTEQSYEVSIRKAEQILMSPEQRYYTRALRKGMSAELFINYITCPFCGKQFAVNTRFSAIVNFRYESLPEEKILQWSNLQESFLKNKEDAELRISFPIKKPESFMCPECNKPSVFSDEVKYVSISLERGKISIKTEITDMSEMLSFKWQGEESLCLTFPMYEVLTFNLRKGKTDIQLRDGENNLLCRRDVTGNPQILEGSMSRESLCNVKIKEEMMKFFTMAWGSELPYKTENITMEKLFKMTQFVCYDKKFYDTVPYELNTERVDHTFAKKAREMHNSRHIADIYKKSELPDVKSIKRLFYRTPGLCFYLDEMEIMWGILKDCNLFCSFISDTKAFRILSDIHVRPVIIRYIRDYCAYKSPSSFIRKAKEDWDKVFNNAVDYCCVNDSIKAEIRQSWFGKGKMISIEGNNPLFSIPMTEPDESIKDCIINGYEFFWLRTVNDYIIAGKRLRNCLTSWKYNDSPVVCVKKGERYIAAIELRDRMIVQAYEHSNNPLGTDGRFLVVFNKWANEYGLKWSPICDNDLNAGF